MPDETYGIGETPETIDGFLFRPVLIASVNWPVLQSLRYRFNPWQLFFEDTQVNRRIQNFKMMRANLNLRFLVNGNQFYYGRALAAYHPIPGYDLTERPDVVTEGGLVTISQQPNVTIDPTDSTGAHMKLPFFWMNNAINIYNEEWKELGDITLFDLVPLRHANGSEDSITISVYAWAEDVNLSQPTSVTSSLYQNQSEFDGKISGPASKVARAAAYLKKAPVIRPYAKATEMAADLVAGVSNAFGFSKPMHSSEAHAAIAKRPLQYVAAANVKPLAMPLSLDFKKEVTVDPRTVGLTGDDDLEIVKIAKRKSYIAQFQWSPKDLSGDILYNFRVNPLTHVTEGNAKHLTPVAFATLPFQYWRGTMCYDFTIVASHYHKGRLRFVYDPVYQATDETNVNRQIVLDIAQTQQVSMYVGWGQEKTYLHVSTLGSDGYHRKERYDFGEAGSNGVLSVFVLNELTGPAGDFDPISIVTHMSACDDFEVAAPYRANLANWTLQPLAAAPPIAGPPARTFPGIAGAADMTSKNNYKEADDYLVSSFDSDVMLLNNTDFNDVAGNTQIISIPVQWYAGETESKTVTMEYRYNNLTTGPVSFNVNGKFYTVNGLESATLESQVLVSPPGTDTVNLANFSVGMPSGGAPGTFQIEVLRFGTYLENRYDFVTVDTSQTNSYTLLSGATVSEDRFVLESSGAVKFDVLGGTIPTFSTVRFEGAIGINPSVVRYYFNDDPPVPYASDPSSIVKGYTVRNIPNADPLYSVTLECTSTPAWYLHKCMYFIDRGNYVNQSNDMEAEENIDEHVGAPRVPVDPNIIFFGEEIPSLRTIMRRPHTFARLEDGYGEISTNPILPYTEHGLPVTGPGSNSLHHYDEFEMPLMEYARRAFLGERGSVRLICHANVNSTLGAKRNGCIQVKRDVGYNGSYSFSRIALDSNAALTLGFEGTTFSESESMPEVDIPWYSNHRFAPTRYGDYVQEDQRNLTRTGVRVQLVRVLPPVSLSKYPGEDYNLFFFLHSPVLVPASPTQT